MLYFEPNFVDEALVLLDRYAPTARVLAGGTLLGLEVRARPAAASAIVNVKRIPELREIAFDGRSLHLGALATARELSDHELVRRYAPLVARAAASIGARQLRTVATLGGNICSGHPAADLSAALLASDATCHIADIAGGPSSLPLADFLRQGLRTLDRRVLLTAVEIPISGGAAAYHKMQTRRAFEMAVVSAAVIVEFAGARIERARIGLGGAADVAMRASRAEASLSGKPADANTAREAARVAAEHDAAPVDDHRASAAYRRQLIRTLTERSLLDAWREHAGTSR
jgi:aerobic carbon-monoxide dehydrogenase medium subunit